jgi:CMP-N,N'-diacetyllegionaminic acid synthase
MPAAGARLCALIPARGGSKGLVRKNVRAFRGTPLVAHAVETARQVAGLDRIVVSTDDAEIADIARRAGADVPFLRPAELATDETPTLPVVQHAVRWLEAHGAGVDAVVLLQATSPLRTAQHVEAAIRKFVETGADSVTTVCAVKDSPYWMQRLDGDRLRPLMAEGQRYGRRQDLPPVYRLTGAVYVSRRDVIMEQGRLLGDDTRAIVVGRRESVDVDDELDLRLCELIAAEEVSA